jgi:hypothetical protein
MKNIIFIISILFLFLTSGFSQENELVELTGIVTGADGKPVINASIQLIGIKNEPKRVTKSDFDGRFIMRICPNQLQEDLVFRISAVNYELDTIIIQGHNTNCIVQLKKLNTQFGTKENEKIYAQLLGEFECGTNYFLESKYFQNCRGEIRSGIELDSMDASKLVWTPIKIKEK